MLNSFFIGSRCLGSTYLGCNLIRYYNGILQLHVNNFGWMSTLDLGLNYFQVNVLLKHGIFWTPNMSWWWWNLSFSTEVRNLWQERPFEECMHLEEDHTRIGTRLVETHWERFLESKKLSNQRGASWKLRLGQLANLSSWPLPPKKQKHTHTHTHTGFAYGSFEVTSHKSSDISQSFGMLDAVCRFCSFSLFPLWFGHIMTLRYSWRLMSLKSWWLFGNPLLHAFIDVCYSCSVIVVVLLLLLHPYYDIDIIIFFPQHLPWVPATWWCTISSVVSSSPLS